MAMNLEKMGQADSIVLAFGIKCEQITRNVVYLRKGGNQQTDCGRISIKRRFDDEKW